MPRGAPSRPRARPVWGFAASWRGASSCCSPAEPRSPQATRFRRRAIAMCCGRAIAQPFDPRDYPSPLSGFRRYLRDDKTGQVQFTDHGAARRRAHPPGHPRQLRRCRLRGGEFRRRQRVRHLRAHPVVGRPVGDARHRRAPDRRRRGLLGGLAAHGRPLRIGRLHRRRRRAARRRLLLQQHQRHGGRARRAARGRQLRAARRSARRADLEPAGRGDPRLRLRARPRGDPG